MLWSKFVTALALMPCVLAKPFDIHLRHERYLSSHPQLQRRTAGSNTYTVVAGDQGAAIAAAYSITFSALSSANSGVNWNALQVGQSLNMPSNRVPKTYTVVSGDTETSIAQKFDVYNTDLGNANPNVNWNSLQIGTQLRVPGYGAYTTYSVVSGDYGSLIASAFEITFNSLSAANPGVNWNDLQIGQVLTVPAGVSPTQNTLPSSATPPKTSTTTSSTKTSSTTTTKSSTPVATTTSKLSTTTSSSKTSMSTSTVSSKSSSISLNPTVPSSTTKPSSTTLITVTSTAKTSSTIISSATSSKTTTITTSSIVVTTRTIGTSSAPGSTSSSVSSTKSTSTGSTTSKTVTTTTAASVVKATGEPNVTPTTTVTGANYVTGGNNNDGVASRADTYTFYQGDGSTADGWPAISQWISFSTMWSNISPYLGQSCQSIFGVANNSPQENQYMYDAIQAVASNSGVDHRLILAAIIQESSGCVRVKTTTSPDGTVTNPGLMQDYNGSGSCNSNGVIQNPCPASEIYQMIEDGTFGTNNSGGGTYVAGLVEDINASPGYSGAQVIYRATRIYNSGSIPASGDLGAPGATRCYASDMANRLMGWVTADSTCTFDN